MDAWSEWRSFLKVMLPSWSTADTTFSRPDGRGAKSQRTTLAVRDAGADATNKYKGCESEWSSVYPLKTQRVKKYRFFHLPGCSWSWRLRRSRRTDPCPAGRESSCFRWTGSGTCWNPPSTTPLAVKKKKEKSYIIDKLVFESQFSTCVDQCNFCVIIWHLKQLEIIMDLLFGLVRISILMQFKKKRKWWLRVAWSQVIKSCNAKNLFLIAVPPTWIITIFPIIVQWTHLICVRMVSSHPTRTTNSTAH